MGGSQWWGTSKRRDLTDEAAKTKATDTELSSRTDVRDLRKISRLTRDKQFLAESVLSEAEGLKMTETA